MPSQDHFLRYAVIGSLILVGALAVVVRIYS